MKLHPVIAMNDLLYAAKQRKPKHYPWFLAGMALAILFVTLFWTYFPK